MIAYLFPSLFQPPQKVRRQPADDYLLVLRSHSLMLLGRIVSLPFLASSSVHSLRRRNIPTTPSAVLSEDEDVCRLLSAAREDGGHEQAIGSVLDRS